MSQRPRRMNFGCGPFPAPGWLNADRLALDGVGLCADLRDGLPLRDACLDYVCCVHVLQDLAFFDVPPALRELRRVLRAGGVLRLVLPDLERAMGAWNERDAAWFHVPDRDARTVGAKLVTQIVWYGSVRTPFTFDFRAGDARRRGLRARPALCARRDRERARGHRAARQSRAREPARRGVAAVSAASREEARR